MTSEIQMPLAVSAKPTFRLVLGLPRPPELPVFPHRPASRLFILPWVSLIRPQLFRNLGKGSSRLHQQTQLWSSQRCILNDCPKGTSLSKAFHSRVTPANHEVTWSSILLSSCTIPDLVWGLEALSKQADEITDPQGTTGSSYFNITHSRPRDIHTARWWFR